MRINEKCSTLKVRIAISLLVAVSQTAVAKESGGHHDYHHGHKCEIGYEYQTLTWNPPFAEARLQATLEKLSEAGKAGFSIAETLPDGTGGQVLVLEKRVRNCAK